MVRVRCCLFTAGPFCHLCQELITSCVPPRRAENILSERAMCRFLSVRQNLDEHPQKRGQAMMMATKIYLEVN